MTFLDSEMQQLVSELEMHMISSVFTSRNYSRQCNELTKFDGTEILLCFACTNEKLALVIQGMF